jgi:hypothetical protein
MLEIKEIPNSDSWKTDTDNPLVNGFRQMMKEFNDTQNEPEVGIFWYDVEDNELFGVVSETASTLKPYFSDMFNANAITTNKLHYAIWQKNANKCRDDRFQNDYTKVPRGRVFEVENEGFIVCVGHWINDYPEAKDVILDEFNLPEDTEFLIDSHWDLGRGWSDKHF